ncbi:hypothetical protein FXO38_34573 [Capsicum annuum]|nr:hypothetical protein FXO38_34573 [Capsicum annuum]
MRKNVHDRFSLNVSYTKMKRVKRIILEKLEGSFIDDFNKLEAYAQELRDTNFGSDVVINISKDALKQGKRRFLRMYVCFESLKSGWRSGLRPFIGLDGTFLKKEYKGILLVPLGKDSMKYFYPLAWAVVDRETSRTWKWFIELLRNSLGLADGEGLTLISDMQKVMGRLKNLKEKGEKWTEKFYSYAIKLYNDFKIIAQSCHVQANGDLGYEKRKTTDKPVAPLKRSIKNNTTDSSIVEKSVVPLRELVDEDETEDELEIKDEQPLLRPGALSKAKTRLKMKTLQQKIIGTKKIKFVGDDHGVSMPTNLPYSPRKMTWKGKSCVTSNVLSLEIRYPMSTYTLQNMVLAGVKFLRLLVYVVTVIAPANVVLVSKRYEVTLGLYIHFPGPVKGIGWEFCFVKGIGAKSMNGDCVWLKELERFIFVESGYLAG